MTIKHLPILLLSFCVSALYGQITQATYSKTNYIVRFKADIKPIDKEIFLKEMNSSILYETRTPGLDITYLQFDSFPFTTGNGRVIFNINSGVGSANSRPETDNAGFDYWVGMGGFHQVKPKDCVDDFSLTMPLGDQPVTIYNLDTGMDEICDNSTTRHNFCGDITCIQLPFGQTPICIDENGHGAHGSGLQTSRINQARQEYSTAGEINIVSYKVFGANGQSTLGPVIAALDQIATAPGRHKVVNNSFSFYGTWDYSGNGFDPLYDTYITLANNNILSIMSAGNDSRSLDGPNKAFPICYFSDEFNEHLDLAHSTIGVGASACIPKPAQYSNYSPSEVDIATIGTAYGPLINGTDNGYYRGTSQATFYISAVAAMLMSHQEVPNLQHIKCALINSSDKSNVWQNYNVASGIVNALEAYEYIISGFDLEECRRQSGVDGGPRRKGSKSLDRNHSKELNVMLSPNPFNNEINVMLTSDEKTNIELSLIDFTGKILFVKSHNLDKGINHINVSDAGKLHDGIYLIQIKNGHQVHTKKLIKHN